MHPETQAMVLQDRAKKGDVLACARVAGIMAIKRTSDIIPMCHPLLITREVRHCAHRSGGDAGEDVPEGWAPARADGQVGFHVLVTAGVTGKTGIEMEALTGASAACLTIYDMCKPSIAAWRSSTCACCTRKAAARACGIAPSVRRCA
ncbi:MAG: cyclic pyranopterin monophosphate synthase MoaC [Collinsella sp.]